MSDEEQETTIEPVFLNDGHIFHWHKPPGSVQFYEGSTTLTEALGLGMLHEDVGPLIVHASATLYRANILRADRDHLAMGYQPSGRQAEPQILFAGQIALYNQGTLPGTELEGYDRPLTGDIWYATAPEAPFLDPTTGLRTLILGNKPEHTIARLEAIKEGFLHQEEARREAQAAAERRTFESGRMRGERGGWRGRCC